MLDQKISDSLKFTGGQSKCHRPYKNATKQIYIWHLLQYQQKLIITSWKTATCRLTTVSFRWSLRRVNELPNRCS